MDSPLNQHKINTSHSNTRRMVNVYACSGNEHICCKYLKNRNAEAQHTLAVACNDLTKASSVFVQASSSYRFNNAR